MEATRAGQEALDMRALKTAFDEGSEPLAEFVVGYALAVTSTHMSRWLPEAMKVTLAAGGNAEARTVREAGEFRTAQNFGDLYFDVTNQEAILWAGERSSTLITRITAKTRAAIRAIIAQSFVEGIPTDQAARLLRMWLGLTPGQAGAAAALRRKILAVPRDKSKKFWAGRMPVRVPKGGVSIEWLEHRIEQYSQRLLNWRARNIARTETIAASNEGQRQLWVQAQKKGLLNPRQMKEWIVTPDDRLCDICEPLSGETARINESFPNAGVQGPPVHPSCRCAMGISAKLAPPRLPS